MPNINRFHQCLIKNKELCYVILLSTLAAVLRLYHIDSQSLWMDELTQVGFYYSSKNIWDVITSAAGQNQPPLDYIIGYFIAQYLPFSDFTARLSACLFGIATVPASYYLFKFIFNQ